MTKQKFQVGQLVTPKKDYLGSPDSGVAGAVKEVKFALGRWWVEVEFTNYGTIGYWQSELLPVLTPKN